MPLHVHNSLTRRLEEFRPLRPPQVSVYGCGPTVYNHVHIGNWASFVFYDVFVRWLRESGWKVTYVENITDIDDKIIQAIRGTKEDRASFTKRWADAFLQGMDVLNCRRADHHPRAADHVPGMVAMIQTLLDKGHAYAGADGSIYFRVASFPTYGELANLASNTIKAGASGRVQSEDYEKAEVADFALWKGWVPDDGDVAWEPTFRIDGVTKTVKGRPGWHIECSVMSSALLGDRIDVHLGGEDLVFPHHQNEIAQSEGATGKRPFATYWLHGRFLLVDGAKMSKSKKNFYTVGDLVAKAGPGAPRAFRYLAATRHYRKPIDFTFAALDAAASTLRNLDDARTRYAAKAGSAKPSGFAKPWDDAFTTAMDNDLETAAAIAAVHGMVHEANKRADLASADAAAAVALLDRADRVLGLGLGSTARDLTPDQKALLDRRAQARAARDFAAADGLRKELSKQGVLVKDGPDGKQEVSFR